MVVHTLRNRDAQALSGTTVRVFCSRFVMKSLVFSQCKPAPWCLAVATMAFVASLPGHSAAQSVAQLDQVVVTATRIPTPITEVIADVSVIDRSVLDQAGQTSLRDVLAQLPGVQLSSNGGYRALSSIFLRGASAAQTLILVDGIRIGSATAGGAALENMPLERIERIEILRGAASALYGPDAVGGVIQIFTRDASDTPQGAAHAGVGSDGQRQIGASLRGRTGVLGYSLGGSREKGKGISVISNSVSGNFNPDADGFDVSSVDASLKAQLSAQHSVSLGWLRSEMDYQFDGTAYPNPLGLNRLTTDAWARPALQQFHLSWDAQWLPTWKSSLKLGRSDDDSVSDYLRATDGAPNGSFAFNTKRRQLSWQNELALADDVLTLLLEHRSEAVDSSTGYTVKSRDINAMMFSYALNRANWNALAVLRRDDNSQFGGFNNWALSGGYKLNPNLRAVASLGTSFQAPSFNQLYYPGFGNPVLQPQQNRATELGLKYQQGKASASALLYHNEIEGFITPVTNEQSSLAVLRGFTLALQNQHGDTVYSASYDYADPRTQPNALRFVRVARHVMNLQARHQGGALGWFGELRFSSHREDNNLSFSGRDVLAGYGLLNLGVDWKISPKLNLLARLNNVTDTQYMLANSYQMPGRNLFVSLHWAS